MHFLLLFNLPFFSKTNYYTIFAYFSTYIHYTIILTWTRACANTHSFSQQRLRPALMWSQPWSERLIPSSLPEPRNSVRLLLPTPLIVLLSVSKCIPSFSSFSCFFFLNFYFILIIFYYYLLIDLLFSVLSNLLAMSFLLDCEWCIINHDDDAAWQTCTMHSTKTASPVTTPSSLSPSMPTNPRMPNSSFPSSNLLTNCSRTGVPVSSFFLFFILF